MSAESAGQVLVVDDEAQMRAIVVFALEAKGFTCLQAASAEQAWRLLAEHRVDLVVLDIMLPGACGLELTERIRATMTVPILLLTAKDSLTARVAGLEAGADDYVSKPFSPRELALRALAIVRRTGSSADEARVRHGSLEIDSRSGQVTWAGHMLHLTDVELRFLTVLARHEGRVVSPRALLNEVWQTSSATGGRQMVKTTVYRLRLKLEHAGLHPDLIASVRGEGYALAKVTQL